MSNRTLQKIKNNRKLKIVILALLACVVLLVAMLIYLDQKKQNSYSVDGDGVSEANLDYTITYKGKTYDYNNSIQSVLLIGVDSRGKMEGKKTVGVDARADNIDLIIMDRRNKTVKVLPISRDTMTPITKLSAQGYETGAYVDHLGYAFSLGDGGKLSCENVCNAVSYLLYNVDVRYYVCTNLDSIAFANNLVGGVEVTVPNDDLKDKYPELTKGARVKLTDRNVEAFLRSRTGELYSNNGRMERQRAFLDGFIEKVKGMGVEDYSRMWKDLKSKNSNILTNMSKAHYLKIIAKIGDYEYDPETSNLKIEGKNKVEDGYDVFYADEEKLKQLVVDTFYVER